MNSNCYLLWIFSLTIILRRPCCGVMNMAIASDSKPQALNSKLSAMIFRLKKLFSRIKKTKQIKWH